MAVLGLCCCTQVSLVTVMGVTLLIAVASCCGARALSVQAQALAVGLVAPWCVGFPRAGIEPMSAALAGGFLTLDIREAPTACFIKEQQMDSERK